MQEPKANSIASDDRDILNLVFQDASHTRFLARKYWDERGSFKARIQRLTKHFESSAKAPLENDPQFGELREQWKTLSAIGEHIKGDIEKAPPPVVPILELGLSKGIQITVHDPETYLKDHVKYSHEITEWLRVISRIDRPTPPAYSACGRYAILTSHFSTIRHGWYSTFVLEKEAKDAWKIILTTSAQWGRAD